MNRVEKYRQIRNLRKKYFLSAVLSISLLAAGICTVDYSTGGLMGDGSDLKIIRMVSNGSYLKIVFMNQVLYVNTQYINRDFGRLKMGMARLLGSSR